MSFWEGDGFAWDREEKHSWTWTGDRDGDGEEAGGEISPLLLRDEMCFVRLRDGMRRVVWMRTVLKEG